MKITFLIDNTPHPYRQDLAYEHGLSFLLEIDDRRILCDMGLSNSYWGNAEKLGISLNDLSFAYVSHGHNDHSGGLKHFLTHTSSIPVYLSSEIFHREFFSSRHTEKRNISTDHNIANQFRQRLNLVSGSCWIAPDIALVSCHKQTYSCPIGNCFLTTRSESEEEHLDSFSHELSLTVCTPEGLIICSSCSHKGALNIIESCCKFTGQSQVKAFIGGLHFVDCNRTEQEVVQFQKEWNNLYPHTQLYTGHCTSDKAKHLLKASVENIHIFHTGLEISI